MDKKTKEQIKTIEIGSDNYPYDFFNKKGSVKYNTLLDQIKKILEQLENHNEIKIGLVVARAGLSRKSSGSLNATLQLVYSRNVIDEDGRKILNFLTSIDVVFPQFRIKYSTISIELFIHYR